MESTNPTLVPIKLLTLNIEGDKHLAEIRNLLKEEKPDVGCFQEVTENGFGQLLLEGYSGHFIPMMNREHEHEYDWGFFGGMAYAVRCSHQLLDTQRYTPSHERPPTKYARHRYLAIIQAQSDSTYTIGATHFTWTPDGLPNEEQWRDYRQFNEVLSCYEEEGIVLCGDFNAHRGKNDIYIDLAKRFKDNLPAEIKSTIDPRLHRANQNGNRLEEVVDTIFTTPHYHVSNVRVISGVSDHMAVVGMVSKNSQ